MTETRIHRVLMGSQGITEPQSGIRFFDSAILACMPTITAHLPPTPAQTPQLQQNRPYACINTHAHIEMKEEGKETLHALFFLCVPPDGVNPLHRPFKLCLTSEQARWLSTAHLCFRAHSECDFWMILLYQFPL